MSKYIVENSQIQCNCGSNISKIIVYSQETSFIKGKKIATKDDYIGNKNIPNFGICSILKSSCTPKTSYWEKYSKNYNINGVPVLLQESLCKCSIGGEISLLDSGENDFISE